MTCIRPQPHIVSCIPIPPSNALPNEARTAVAQSIQSFSPTSSSLPVLPLQRLHRLDASTRHPVPQTHPMTHGHTRQPYLAQTPPARPLPSSCVLHPASPLMVSTLGYYTSTSHPVPSMSSAGYHPRPRRRIHLGVPAPSPSHIPRCTRQATHLLYISMISILYLYCGTIPNTSTGHSDTTHNVAQNIVNHTEHCTEHICSNPSYAYISHTHLVPSLIS